jgi:D-proline reductase (dithiol) PrdB
MEPIRYVDALAEKYGAMGFPPYDWSRYDDAPLTPLTKPLAECTVSMLTSGGVSQCSMPAWDPDARNDFRLDEVPSAASSDGFQIHDNYYDHTDADTDLNCVFPLDRLREMAAAGEIGSVSRRLWSGFMGRIYKRREVLELQAPAFALQLKADGVDVLVAVPA